MSDVTDERMAAPDEAEAPLDPSTMPPENRPTQNTVVRSISTHTILAGIGILFIAPMLWLHPRLVRLPGFVGR